MLQKLQKRKNEAKNSDGFTIIEVLIVLAIAGLILLIVFLAVPALQRSSRNTQRKNDVSAISSAVANFIDDNGGNLPTNVGVSGSNALVCGGTCGASGVNSESAKLGYYSPANISIQTTNTVPTADSTKAVIVTGWSCNDNNTGLSATANTRSAAILYWTETGSGTPPTQCVEQ